MGLRALITELRRRRVFRAAGWYIVTAWVAVQVISLVFPAIRVPENALLFVWATAVFLFPLVIVFAWFYEYADEGLTRTAPAEPGERFDPSLRRTDYVILFALALVASAIVLKFTSRIEASFDFGSISQNTIAVLPFDNLSGNQGEQYFVAGMQASIISGLSRVSRLRVTSKTSTVQFANTRVTLPEVGEALGVRRVVEGTVLRDDDRVNISVQLLDAERDEQIWAGSFEDDIEDIVFLQNRVAQEIASQVRVAIQPQDQEQFDGARVVNQEAYLAFLRGVFHVEKFNPEDMQIAAGHFQRAVEIDPDYALGHWGLAKLCGFMGQAGMLTPDEARAQCMPPIDAALSIDPLLPEAHMGRANLLTWQQFDWKPAEASFRRAIELNPSYAEAHMFYSHYLGIMGDLDASTRHMGYALELDPLNPFVRGLHSIQLFMLDDFEQAITVAEEALAASPGQGFGYITLNMAHHELGNYDAAVENLAELLRVLAGRDDLAGHIEQLHSELGYRDAMLVLAEQMAAASETEHIPPMTVAMLFDHAGDIERSIDWLEISWRRHDPDAPYQAVNIKNPAVRGNARYQALLREFGLDTWADRFERDYPMTTAAN